MSIKTEGSHRTLILCFDGTANLYDDANTNVIKLFSLLKRDDKGHQLVYYQPGIGTYSSSGIISSIGEMIASRMDEAMAWYLELHVMGGYKFLMQNYLNGDRICLFGFSRGAYTARALAGMLHKVGLLPRDNEEQVGFAYNMYKNTGKRNQRLAFGFKQTFSRTVQIEFMGCWDTVSSVGIFWRRHLPFTSSNTIIKRFRHALSLDERRAKFQPNTWHRDAPSPSCALRDPDHGTKVIGSEDPYLEEESSKDTTDVLEVWFSGCHSDVGGGWTLSEAKRSLSHITLRWMLREIVQSKCGILFEPKAFKRAGIPLSILDAISNPNIVTNQSGSEVSPHGNLSKASLQSDRTFNVDSIVETPANPTNVDKEDALDALELSHDELKIDRTWWILEITPLFVYWQDKHCTWRRTFRWNLGRGRKICADSPNIHTSVQTRMTSEGLSYTPKARWDNYPDATWVT